MKIVDIEGGFKVPLSEEEAGVAAKAKEQKVYGKKLKEREREIARKLVERGVLSRGKNKEGIYYYFRGLEDLDRRFD